MNEITIRNVDKENWRHCSLLEVTDEQKQVFPFPVLGWIAESKFESSYILLSIYLDQTLIGFSVYGQDPEDGEYWIIAFMIDKKYQRNGYGKRAMKTLIDLIIKRHKCNRITIGHRPQNAVAERLYSSLGFQETGRTEKEVKRILFV